MTFAFYARQLLQNVLIPLEIRAGVRTAALEYLGLVTNMSESLDQNEVFGRRPQDADLQDGLNRPLIQTGVPDGSSGGSLPTKNGLNPFEIRAGVRTWRLAQSDVRPRLNPFEIRAGVRTISTKWGSRRRCLNPLRSGQVFGPQRLAQIGEVTKRLNPLRSGQVFGRCAGLAGWCLDAVLIPFEIRCSDRQAEQPGPRLKRLNPFEISRCSDGWGWLNDYAVLIPLRSGQVFRTQDDEDSAGPERLNPFEIRADCSDFRLALSLDR